MTAQALARSRSAAATTMCIAFPAETVLPILAADAVHGSQSLRTGIGADIVDGSGPHQVGRTVVGAAIGVKDGDPLAREVLEQAFANDLHHVADGVGVVVSVHAHENVNFANAD